MSWRKPETLDMTFLFIVHQLLLLLNFLLIT